jgi:hypothetical protein
MGLGSSLVAFRNGSLKVLSHRTHRNNDRWGCAGKNALTGRPFHDKRKQECIRVHLQE